MISLSTHHTFGLTAHCSDFHLVQDTAQLTELFSKYDPRRSFVLGEGSNCIFLEDFYGAVFKMAMSGKHVKTDKDDYLIEVAAGENWHNLVVWCLEKGISGLENLALIPGTVGAAPIQNIGAYGLEIERFIDAVECYDRATGEIFKLNKDECQFAYRDSVFKHQLLDKCVITKVLFRIPTNWRAEQGYAELSTLTNPTAQDIFNKVVEIRRRKLPDPDVTGNAGSFFKNPHISLQHYQLLKKQWNEIPGFKLTEDSVKVPAAWLIDKLGFKGKRNGGICCHSKQPLVLTNLGDGTGEQLLSLAREIRDNVKQTFDIRLENEVRLVTNEGLISL